MLLGVEENEIFLNQVCDANNHGRVCCMLFL